jgi:hypothetical protein
VLDTTAVTPYGLVTIVGVTGLLQEPNDGTFSRVRTARILGSVPPQLNVMSRPKSVALARNTTTAGYLKSGFGRGGVGEN